MISPTADSVIREINIEAARLRVAATNVVTVLTLVGLAVAATMNASVMVDAALAMAWLVMMFPVRARAHTKLVQAYQA